MGQTKFRCIWCGHKEAYNENRPASLTACKSRMTSHELNCERSPIVKRMEALREANADMSRAFKRKRNRMIEAYLNPRRKKPFESEVLDDLASMVRGTAKTEDVVIHISREFPERCAICSTVAVIPQRIPSKHATHVALLCRQCQPSSRRLARDIIKDLDHKAEHSCHEMAFMWKDDAGRVRMICGDDIRLETIS